jgi:transposase InsO family protein
VHAPQPNLAANIDLCVVPITHTASLPLASASVSQAKSGALPEVPPAPQPTNWPGQVFQDPNLSYAEQMLAYAEGRAAKRASKGRRKQRRRQKQAERAELNAHSAELRLSRRQQRLRRRREDAAWQALRQAQRQAEQSERQRTRAERRRRTAERQAERAQWQAAKTAHQALLQQRQQEDAAWRQARLALRDQLAQLAAAPLAVVWYVVLVVVDNGTRRCLGLPLFEVGVHVTADMIVSALQAVCPPDLQFLISDNGAQFIAQAFAQFIHDTHLTHVRIAPYHPCTNGIAERFVLTLKDWLETHSWNSPQELEALLVEFRQYYNDRPHQGAELDGLSPNEFARRLFCSTC